MNHFQDKFEEILEEKTDEIDEKIQAIDEIDDLDKAKPKVEEFKWGDIAMPDKF
jgi:predicted ribonuclease toxin of YeeF-YezG toxin-antitoxin module